MNDYVYIEIPGKGIPYKARKEEKPRVFYSQDGLPKKIYSPKFNPLEKKQIEIQVRCYLRGMRRRRILERQNQSLESIEDCCFLPRFAAL